MPNTKWTGKFLMGQVDRYNIYLSAPSWDCNWYWGFGYLGNRDCHYHLDGINHNKNMYDAIIEHFGDTLTISKEDLWTFCELMKSAYALTETAEVLGRGGSHYTDNPCKDIIMNTVETTRINTVVLPAIFDAVYDMLTKKVVDKAT